MTAASAFAVIALTAASTSAAPPETTRFTLKNGIRVEILHVEGASSIAMISFLPLGLTADGAGRTQWSHLVEHLTLRTTGPIDDYRQRNAETMADGMHLDFVGHVDQWREGLDLQAAWLSGRSLEAATLDEERPKALAESTGTVAALATHKWAAAAWNQVHRHGRRNVRVLGDPASGTAPEFQAYRDDHLVILDRVVITIMGGVPAAELRPALETRFGAIASTAAALPAATTPPPAERDVTATWDLEASHYLETYRLPAVTHDDYPVFVAVPGILTMRIMQDPALRTLTGTVLCTVDLQTPEAAYLAISAPLRPGADVDQVRDAIRGHLDALAGRDAAELAVANGLQMSRAWGEPPDIGLVLRRLPRHVTEGMAFGNLAIQHGILEFRYGAAGPALGERVGRLTVEAVREAAARHLPADRRRSLVLRAGG